jgi:hypothetical protein
VVFAGCRQGYDESTATMDLLLLSRDGSTVYNGPLRLIVPYFLSLGIGCVECHDAALRDIVACPEATAHVLEGKVSLPRSPERSQ